jgi:hypothetical protein
MSFNKKHSSAALASLAAQTLRDEHASNIQRSLAGSALAQADRGKQTGPEMEDRAARALRNERSSDLTRELAGSVLSQANRER